LHPDFEELRKHGIVPEMEIMGRLILFFGPLPSGLLTHINDEEWVGLLRQLSQMMADQSPSQHFEQWDEKDYRNLDPDTKRVISRMTDLDPARRATMDEILKDPWWAR
jgi:serine/threonine protein kinase